MIRFLNHVVHVSPSVTAVDRHVYMIRFLNHVVHVSPSVTAVDRYVYMIHFPSMVGAVYQVRRRTKYDFVSSATGSVWSNVFVTTKSRKQPKQNKTKSEWMMAGITIGKEQAANWWWWWWWWWWWVDTYVLRCQLTYEGQVVTNAEARFNKSLVHGNQKAR